jgi:hypothetical protein
MLTRIDADEILRSEDATNLFAFVLSLPEARTLSPALCQFLTQQISKSTHSTLTIPYRDLEPAIAPFVSLYDTYFPAQYKHTVIANSQMCIEAIQQCFNAISVVFPPASQWKVTLSSNPRKVGFVCRTLDANLVVPPHINSNTVHGKIAHEVFVHAFRKIAQTNARASTQPGYKVLEEGIATALEQYIDGNRNPEMNIKMGAYSHRLILYALLVRKQHLSGYTTTDCIRLFEIYTTHHPHPQISMRNLLSRVFREVLFVHPSDLIATPDLTPYQNTVIYYLGVKRLKLVAQHYPQTVLNQLPYRKWDPSLYF